MSGHLSLPVVAALLSGTGVELVAVNSGLGRSVLSVEVGRGANRSRTPSSTG